MMGSKQMEPLLRRWRRTLQRTDRALDELLQYGLAQDSRIVLAVNALEFAFTDQVAQRVGDVNRTLHWYWIDNELGRCGIEAQAGSWPRPQPVKTVRQLAQLIEGTAQ